MPVTLERRGPGFAQIKRDVDRLRKSEVLVGIPASRTLRKGEPITNSALMFILSKGSPIRNIPARPTIEPSIEENKIPISAQLAQGAEALLQNNPVAAEKAMMRAGMLAVNAAKRKFGSSELAPNAPSTQRRKGAKLKPPQMVNNPLIDTGALRRSLVAVVRVIGKTPVESPASE
jgi:hypothetical protein